MPAPDPDRPQSSDHQHASPPPADLVKLEINGASPPIEVRGRWHLLTADDLQSMEPDGVAGDRRQTAILRRCVGELEYEHLTEQKIPRSNSWRPYRLTIGDAVACALVCRASEAFNLCEVDALLFADDTGPAIEEVVRAALLFLLSDAARSGTSMALQFTGPEGVPDPLRRLADSVGVALTYADRGTLAPDESRELFLRLCGLPAAAQERVRLMAAQRFFSVERVAYQVTRGDWSAPEAEILLTGSPYPDLVFGAEVPPESRHLGAHAAAFAALAVLAGIIDRALRVVGPQAGATEWMEEARYLRMARRFLADDLAVTHGPAPHQINLPHWTPPGSAAFAMEPGGSVTFLPRPRYREAIRAYAAHDIADAHAAADRDGLTAAAVVYPADYLTLAPSEQAEASGLAVSRNVAILACPEPMAVIEAEAWRRLQLGRTVRR